MRQINIWCDGSIHVKENIGISAWISDTGYQMVAHVPTLGWKSTEAELYAISKALQWALRGGFDKICVYTDCKPIVDLLSNPKTYIRPREWIAELSELLYYTTADVRIGFIPRRYNKAADRLCRDASKDISNSMSIFEVPNTKVSRINPQFLVECPLDLPKGAEPMIVKRRTTSKKVKKGRAKVNVRPAA